MASSLLLDRDDVMECVVPTVPESWAPREELPYFSLDDVPSEYLRLDEIPDEAALDLDFADSMLTQKRGAAGAGAGLDLHEYETPPSSPEASHRTESMLGEDAEPMDEGMDQSGSDSEEEWSSVEAFNPAGVRKGLNALPDLAISTRSPLATSAPLSAAALPALTVALPASRLAPESEGEENERADPSYTPRQATTTRRTLRGPRSTSANPSTTSTTTTNNNNPSATAATTTSVASPTTPTTAAAEMPARTRAPRTSGSRGKGRRGHAGRPAKRQSEDVFAETLRARKRNRIAARRNRALRKMRHELMLQHTEQLGEDNAALRAAADSCREQIARLVSTIRARFKHTPLHVLLPACFPAAATSSA